MGHLCNVARAISHTLIQDYEMVFLHGMQGAKYVSVQYGIYICALVIDVPNIIAQCGFSTYSCYLLFLAKTFTLLFVRYICHT